MPARAVQVTWAGARRAEETATRAEKLPPAPSGFPSPPLPPGVSKGPFWL